MKMKQPENISELYIKAHFVLLYCRVNRSFTPYGNLHNPRRFYDINNYGNFVIMDKTDKAIYTTYDHRIEIPKYAPFNHA